MIRKLIALLLALSLAAAVLPAAVAEEGTDVPAAPQETESLTPAPATPVPATEAPTKAPATPAPVTPAPETETPAPVTEAPADTPAPEMAETTAAPADTPAPAEEVVDDAVPVAEEEPTEAPAAAPAEETAEPASATEAPAFVPGYAVTDRAVLLYTDHKLQRETDPAVTLPEGTVVVALQQEDRALQLLAAVNGEWITAWADAARLRILNDDETGRWVRKAAADDRLMKRDGWLLLDTEITLPQDSPAGDSTYEPTPAPAVATSVPTAMSPAATAVPEPTATEALQSPGQTVTARADTPGKPALSFASGKVTVSWTDIGADRYTVWRSTKSTGTFQPLTEVNGCTYTDASVTAGKYYFYRISVADGEPGTIASIRCNAMPAVKATRQADGYVQLKWTEQSGAYGYQVWGKTAGGNWTKLKGITGKTKVTWTNTAPTNGDAVTYRVRTMYRLSDGTTVPGGFSPDLKVNYGVKPVTGLTATPTSTGVKLSWNAMARAKGYRIYVRYAGETQWTKLTDAAASATSWTYKTPTLGKEAEYRVRTIGMLGTKVYAAGVIVPFTYTKGKTPVCTASGRGKMTVSWKASAGADSYILQWKTKNGTWSSLETTERSADIDVINGTWYLVQVKPVHAGCVGYRSAQVEFTPVYKLAAPVLKVDTGVWGRVRVTWPAVEDATEYRVYTRAGTSGDYKYVTVTEPEFLMRVNSGSTWQIKVKARCKDETVTYDGNISAVKTVKPVWTMAAPKLTLTQTTLARAAAAWQPVDGAMGYLLEYRSEGETDYHKLELDASTVGVTLPATTGTALQARITALTYVSDELGEDTCKGTRSAAVSLTPVWKLPLPVLTMTKGDWGRIHLQWKPVDGAVGYTVYVKRDGETAYTRTDISSDQYELTIPADSGRKVNAYVKVLYHVDDELGQQDVLSPRSDIVSLTPTWTLPAPALTLTKGEWERVQASWTPVSGADGYRLYWRQGASGAYTCETLPADADSLLLRAKNNQALSVYVQPFAVVEDELGTDTYAGTKSTTRSLTPAWSLARPVTTLTRGKWYTVHIDWQPSPGANAYRLRYTLGDEPEAQVMLDADAVSYVLPAADGQKISAKLEPCLIVSDELGEDIYTGTATAWLTGTYAWQPGVPVLKADTDSWQTLTLRWSRCDYVDAYVLRWRLSPEDDFTEEILPANVLTRTIPTDSTVFYEVSVAARIVDEDGESFDGEAASASGTKDWRLGVPEIASTVQTVYVPPAFRVTWSEAAMADSYQVRCQNAADSADVILVDAAGTCADITRDGGSWLVAVRSVKTEGGIDYYGEWSEACRVDLVRYFALAIGQSNYTTMMHLDSPANDVASLAKVLKRTDLYTSVTVRNDLNPGDFQGAVNSAYAGAGENDVCLFYYSGHGCSTPGTNSGSLVGVNGTFLRPTTLASMLGALPGHVVVIIDACHSGSLISRSVALQTDDSQDDFNESFLSAFRSRFVARYAELAQPKFSVLTASSKDEDSYSVESDPPFGVFTMYMLYGMGYNERTGAFLTSRPADTDHNGILTLQ